MYDYNYWPRLEMDPGPWRDEPDHLQFESHGLPCLIVRHPLFGSLCGYVGVLPGHPLHGVRYTDIDYDLPAHGDLTFSGACEPGRLICHVGENEPWWLGFDCGHFMDLQPGVGEMLAIEREFAARVCRFPSEWSPNYRDLKYVRGVCRELAAALSAIATVPPQEQPNESSTSTSKEAA